MKGIKARWGTAVGIFLMIGMLFTQTVDIAVADSARYIEFAAADSVEDADEAAAAMGNVIAARQKAKEDAEKAERQEKLPQVDAAKPMIALTFDDGPSGAVTERILNILEENGGRGTFFVVGYRVGSYPSLVQRMIENGHQLGNHSYDHKDFTKLSVKNVQAQVADTQHAALGALGDEYAYGLPAVVRLPYGAANSTVKAAVGMPMIQWSVDTRDWQTRNAAKTVTSVLSSARDGDIILMHDLYPQTAAACEEIIPKLRERGFQLVTVDELFAAKGIELKPGVMYFKAR